MQEEKEKRRREKRESGGRKEKAEMGRGRSRAEWRWLGDSRSKWQRDPGTRRTSPPPQGLISPFLLPTPQPHTQPQAPLCVSTLLSALWGRQGLQAGRALQWWVPQLWWGINTCGVAGRTKMAARPLWQDPHPGGLELLLWRGGWGAD